MSRSPAAPEAFEQLKRESLGQLLLKCARLFNERAMARVNQRAGAPLLRASHTNLFPHLDFAGVRLTELARRMGISKQAIGQTVAELEELGVVETLSDPQDARAKLVRFTKKGAEGIQQGLATFAEIERELTPEVGAETLQGLHSALLALESALTKTQGSDA